MDEEIKTSTGSIVPEHQKEWRHGRGFDHVAQTQKGGKRSTAPGLHEKTASAQVRGGTVQACGRAASVHAQPSFHIQTLHCRRLRPLSLMSV